MAAARGQRRRGDESNQEKHVPFQEMKQVQGQPNGEVNGMMEDFEEGPEKDPEEEPKENHGVDIEEESESRDEMWLWIR
ncbi:hypothetical protein ACH5RR_017387 [Cinchona calisaya]|uniref:GAGE domain-containing protein n=1 Tax=Cinchona calisaya TaxID=153742 RepID=A0ABD2ZIQ3_9GENT